MPVIAKVLEAGASAGRDRIKASGLELAPDNVNVELVFSIVAACMAKKALEKSGAESVEVKISVYADIDKILEGKEEIEYLEVEVKGLCKDPRVSSEDLKRGAIECPIFKLIEDKTVRIISLCDKGKEGST
ncbi:MAG: hypothetical protein F7B17_01435 [Desulfurococcales archaeon]|nr:hypothetical protein [Desulfurococcales archaeon]